MYDYWIKYGISSFYNNHHRDKIEIKKMMVIQGVDYISKENL